MCVAIYACVAICVCHYSSVLPFLCAVACEHHHSCTLLFIYNIICAVTHECCHSCTLQFMHDAICVCCCLCMPSFVSATPAMAKGTASIQLAYMAKKATLHDLRCWSPQYMGGRAQAVLQTAGICVETHYFMTSSGRRQGLEGEGN